MRILDKYILKEFIGPFLFGVSVPLRQSSSGLGAYIKLRT